MIPYTEIAGICSGIVGIIGYGFYYRNIWKKKRPPHVFTWLALSILVGFAFFAQVQHGETWGAVSTGITELNCIALTVVGLFFRIKKITWAEWLCFASSLIGIVWWRMTGDLVAAILIVTAADALAFAPTVMRGWKEPFGEEPIMWMCAGMKFIIGLFLLKEYVITTALFPAACAILNVSFVAIILFRRRYIIKDLNLDCPNYGGTD